MSLERRELTDRIAALLPRIGGSAISPSAYDTARVALLREPGGTAPAFPESGRWLLDHQHPDGSWGGAVAMPHDRCICTLAAVIALTELSRDEMADRAAAQDAADRGAAYLRSAVGVLSGETRDTAGFELVFPSLLERARGLGIELPYEGFSWLHDLRRRKLDLLALLGGNLGHAVYNLEAFEQLPDSVLDGSAQSQDGSFGCSPASTAGVLETLDNAAALRYLRGELAASGDGSVGTVRPFQVFERAWILADVQRTGVDFPELKPEIDRLREEWTPRGVGMASTGIPGDGDCTALAFTVLSEAGHRVEASAMEHYRRESGYVTYPFELNASLSCNAHVLTALRRTADADEGAVRCALEALRANRSHDGAWYDKWHISPYYTTGHAIEAVHGLDETLCRDAVDWLVRTQRPDGGWGIGGSSGEETAYALTGLLSAEDHLDEAGLAAIEAGAAHLAAWADTTEHPELWVGKSLYAPLLVIRGLILCTLLRLAVRAERREDAVL